MSAEQKKRLFILGGVALAALIVVVALIIAFGGSGRRYARYMDAAETAFLRRDYDNALQQLEKAMEIDATEDAYLMMANTYYAKGDLEQAMQVLYLGYSRVGGKAIEDMLEDLKRQGNRSERGEEDSIEVAGQQFTLDAISVVLSGKGLTNEDFQTLCTLKSLQNLSVSDNKITDISAITALTNLTSLQLAGNQIADLTPLRNLSGLKTLYLDNNPVRDVAPLYQLRNLRTLSLKGVNLTVDDLDALEQALPNCFVFSDIDRDAPKELRLGGKSFYSDVTELNLSDLDLTDISVLSQCKNLTRLDLRDNNIRDLSPLADLQNLEWLCLTANRVDDLSSLKDLVKLSYLDLDGNRITDIGTLSTVAALEELWLDNNPIRDFTALKSLTNLRRLGLKNTGIRDTDVENLYELSNLRELTLEGNSSISAGKFEEMSEKLPSCAITHDQLLWTITLGGKTYTSDAVEIIASDSGVESLSGLEHFTDLVFLDLDDNKITDLEPLYGLKKLKTLYLRNNDELTAESIAALQEKLPGCQIFSNAREPEPTPSPTPTPTPSPTPTPTPTPTEPLEPVATQNPGVDIGSGAARGADGIGNAYAILWCAGDETSAAVREGISAQAETLGMNLVFDSSFPDDSVDFSPYLAGIDQSGADVVFLAVDTDTAYLIRLQAAALSYLPEFIQVYTE